MMKLHTDFRPLAYILSLKSSENEENAAMPLAHSARILQLDF